MDNKEAKYIDRIEIKGLWSRYDVDWKLNPDVNILVGENGTGKSTILEKVAELLFASIKYAENPKDITYKYVSKFKGLTKIHFNESRILATSYYISTNDEIKIEINRGFNDFKLNYIKTFDTTSFKQEDDKSYINTPLDRDLEKAIIQYLGYQNKLLKRANENKGNLNKKNYFFETINNLFKVTKKHLIEEEEFTDAVLMLKFIDDDSNKINLFQLSSGEKQILLLLLTVLCQDEKPSVLIMDEPELSLHFEWQYELIKIIRTLNPNCQLIIATHSSSIFAKGWMDKLFFIEEANGKGIRKKILQTA